jgi:hypothetical protein
MRRRTLTSFALPVLLILLLPAALLHADDAPKPPDVVTGIKGETKIVYVSGRPGTKIPDPVPIKGVIVRVFPLEGDKPVAEIKSDDMGKFKISLPAGEYRVQVVTPGDSIIEPPTVKVTVKEGEVAEVKLMPLTRNNR